MNLGEYVNKFEALWIAERKGGSFDEEDDLIAPREGFTINKKEAAKQIEERLIAIARDKT